MLMLNNELGIHHCIPHAGWRFQRPATARQCGAGASSAIAALNPAASLSEGPVPQ
jgi:hypothetical protein